MMPTPISLYMQGTSYQLHKFKIVHYTIVPYLRSNQSARLIDVTQVIYLFAFSALCIRSAIVELRSQACLNSGAVAKLA